MNKNRLLRAILSLLIIIMGLSTSAGGGGTGWKTLRVEAGRTFRNVTNSSLKIFNGNPGVAYGSDHLYYASLEGGESATTIVDDDWGVGMFASLAFEPVYGYPRISYYDHINEELKYAKYTPGLGWSISELWTSTGPNTISLDNTSNHYPHILYADGNQHLAHAWMDCFLSICSFHTESIDGTVLVSGTNIAFAIDPSNEMYAAYMDEGGSLLFNETIGGAWAFPSILDASSGSHLMEPSLAVTSDGDIGIAYVTDDGLEYAYFSGGSWTHEIVYDESGSFLYPSDPSLQLPNDDVTQPWISFIDGDGNIQLATFGDGICPGTTGNYDCLIVDDSTDFRVTSLVVDISDPSYNLGQLVSIDALTGELRYEYQDTSYSWHNLAIDHSTNVGLYSSLVVDADGPHIGAYDRDQTRFRFAEYDQGDEGGCGDDGLNNWYRCETVVNTGEMRASLDIGISSNGYRHMAIYDPSFPVLQYATSYPSWMTLTIDNTSTDVGRYASLGFSPITNGAVIAYMDSANGQLKVATELLTPSGTGCANNYWQCDSIESIGTGGFGISLAFDYRGYPLISYVDETDHLLKMASFRPDPGGTTCLSQFWNCESTQGIGAPIPTFEGETSIWGSPTIPIYMISWYNSDDTTLMLTSFAPSSGWITETADQAMDTGSDNDLTTIGNMPVITYVNDHWQNLMLASRIGGGNGNCGEGSNWYCQVLDEDGWVGYSPSIQNVSGRLYISYYDWTNGDLKLAFQALPSFMPILKKP